MASDGVTSGDFPPVPPEDRVVSLTDFLSKRHTRRECYHQRIVVDENNRRVVCRECDKEVEPFQALLMLSDKASSYQQTYDKMRKDHRNLAGYVPHLRVVRNLESMWRGKRLPMCPHCKKGVTAEGLNAMGWVHQSYAEAVAKQEAEEKTGAEIINLATSRQDDAGEPAAPDWQQRAMEAEEALRDVRAAIMNQNGLNELSVVCTVWVRPGESAVDRIDGVLGEPQA